MSTNIEESVIEKLRALPLEKQREVLEFVKILDQQQTGETTQEKPPQRAMIWDKIGEIMRDVPDEVWTRIPTDGSINIDHYLYGAPKKKS